MSHSTGNTTRFMQKSAIASAMVAALGGSVICDSGYAANLTFSFTGSANGGLFTMLDPTGISLQNTSYPYYGDPTWGYGFRTQLTGTFTIDTATRSGSMSINPFQFFNGNPTLPATAKNITFTDASSDPVNTGGATLLLANMQFDWNGNDNIPVSLVWNASGLMTAINSGLSLLDVVDATGCATCATPASNGILKSKFPIGPVPIATTSFDPTHTGGTNSLGQLPIAGNDGIGGSPMQAGPFQNFNANFDFTSLTLIDDGSGPAFTQPADVNSTAPEQSTPASINVNLGTVTDETAGVTVAYSTDGKPVSDVTKTWIADNGSNNTIAVNATQAVTALTVDWRATSGGGSQSFKVQNVTVTITDTTAPVINSTPADVTVSVTSTADSVCFGTLTATDAIDPTVQVQWSHDGFNWTNANPVDNCSTGFGPNANIMNWRALDDTGNTATYQQDVTLNLPTGITGKACTVDLATAGSRLLEGRFTMRTSTGAVTGTIDNGVTGDIDTTVFCTDPDLADCNPNPPAATLTAGQVFFGFGWTANPVRLFGPGTWTFETCPFPRSFDGKDWVSPDGSNKCVATTDPTFLTDGSAPNPLTMTVGQGQIGAHMLFDWSVNKSIDVAVVWDADCNEFELTTTDPDGDGILASRMVDGPFKGFNAAFDVSPVAGEPPIADGGYTTTVPAVQNPISGDSPLPLAATNPVPSVADSAAVRSCVGDCFDFATTNLRSATDGAGSYQYAQAVLPLSEAVPFWSLYRKFDTATQTWGPFTIDSRNDVKTAPLDVSTGGCPEPGNGTYDRPITGALADKLREGDECVQLTIEDGGPNDADGAVNASVSDPGGIAEVPATPLPSPSTSGGGCSVTTTDVESPSQHSEWWLLASFLGFLGFLGWRRKQRS